MTGAVYTSPALTPLKWYRKLVTKNGRIKAGAFLVEGNRVIEQIITTHPSAILEIVTVDELPPAYHNYPARIVTESQFLSISSTKTPQGVLAVIRLPADIYSNKLLETIGTKILLLEDIQDPGNVGTLIRTASAFGFSGIILTENCADPVSPKCVQSTAGTLLSVWIRRTPDYLELAHTLHENGYILAAADLNGLESPDVLGSQDKLMLALGNEASGLSPSILGMADYRVKIPIDREKAESINVAACGAICMYLSSNRH